MIELSTKRFTSGHSFSCGCRRPLSKGEYEIKKILENNNIIFKEQFSFEDCTGPKTGYKYKYDFAILDNKNNPIRLIEFDGEQHYKENRLFRDSLDNIQFRDEIKNNYAKEHHIPLIRIPYTFLNKITLDMLLFDDTFLIK